MVEMGNVGNELPIISDPREFISRPFLRIEIGELESAPDRDFLKWLPSIKRETALVLQAPSWYIVKASEIGVPSWTLPPSSDTLIHSHYDTENASSLDSAIPSLGDFHNASPTARELIASSYGITEYWYIDDAEGRRNVKREIMSFTQRFNTAESFKEYLKFLEDNKARYKITPWEKVSKQNLETLLHP